MDTNLSEEVPYEEHSHYFITQSDKCTVYYKVKNSFDYINVKDNAHITVNTPNNGVLDVYYYDSYRDINTNVSLNPLHSNIPKGSVYFTETDEPIIKHKVHYQKVRDMNYYSIQLFDKYNNVIIGKKCEVSVHNLDASVKIFNVNNSIEESGIIIIALKSEGKISTGEIHIQANQLYKIALSEV